MADDTRDELASRAALASRAELASRAALAGRSLQEHLRLLRIELASQPEVSTVVERIRARKNPTGPGLDAGQILGYLDAGRE